MRRKCWRQFSSVLLPQADLWKVKNPGEKCRKQPFICSRRGSLIIYIPFYPFSVQELLGLGGRDGVFSQLQPAII